MLAFGRFASLLPLARGLRLPRLLLWATCGVGLLVNLALAEPAPFEKEVQPFLVKYCRECHNGKKKEGELDLEKYKSHATALKAADFWEQAAKRVEAKEMPPEGSPQPDDEARKKLSAWAKAVVDAKNNCENLATDDSQHFYKGYVMSRRLNRTEYNNAVRDLVGLDLKPADAFPADGAGGEGFDTTGSALFTSAILMEKYLEAADRVIERALPDKFEGAQAKELAAIRQRIIFALPSDTLKPREAARQVLAAFARRAYRRPVDAADVDRLLAMFDRGQQRKDSYLASVRLALKAVLISPNFLFVPEPEPEKDGIYRLAPLQIASRLSLFLWSSIPDEELLAVAEAGKLADPDVLRQQTQRMLQDSKSQALGESFAVQWLGVGALGGAARPDARRFPEFNDELVAAMRAETVLFFHSVFHDDQSLLVLLDADYTFVNERLAKHYGIPDVQGKEMRRVTLSDKNRGGILGLGSVLSTTTYPLRTSPVLRGRWVLEDVLGSKVPPPPPNVPTLPEDDKVSDGLTLRQRLEKHRTKPECASCHARIDPLGFGLEGFDPIGRWRTTINGQPIDDGGKLPSGEQFRGPAELKQVILKKKQDFVRNLTRKLLGYALGRELNQFDRCVVDDTMKALEREGYRASVLIDGIVQSYPFQHRYAKK